MFEEIEKKTFSSSPKSHQTLPAAISFAVAVVAAAAAPKEKSPDSLAAMASTVESGGGGSETETEEAGREEEEREEEVENVVVAAGPNDAGSRGLFSLFISAEEAMTSPSDDARTETEAAAALAEGTRKEETASILLFMMTPAPGKAAPRSAPASEARPPRAESESGRASPPRRPRTPPCR